MTKTTYVAIAPDGSQLTRSTDRAYTHAILVQTGETWNAEAFCDRKDLAEKKLGEHPGSIIVEVTDESKMEHDPLAEELLGDDAPQADTTDVAEEAEKRPRLTVQSIVEEMVAVSENSYEQIVEEVKRRIPGANTTRRSVASIASRLRKSGVEVPARSTRG